MSRKNSVPVSIRRYKEDVYAVLCRSIYYKNSSQVRCLWLDDQGRLREGVVGILDALEADPIVEWEVPQFCRALERHFGRRIRNRLDWKQDVAERIRTGEGVEQWEL